MFAELGKKVKELKQCRPETCKHGALTRDLPTEISEALKSIDSDIGVLIKKVKAFQEMQKMLQEEKDGLTLRSETVWKKIKDLFPEMKDYSRLSLSDNFDKVMGTSCFEKCIIPETAKILGIDPDQVLKTDGMASIGLTPEEPELPAEETE